MSALPLGWTKTSVGEVLESWDRFREPLNANERSTRQGPYAYYGANGQVGTIDAYRYDGDFILVAEDGGYFDQPERGVAYTASGKFWVNNHAHVLRPLGHMPLRYFLHALNSVDWMPHVGGSTRLKLTAGALGRVPLLLPPLNEQRRIVTKLDTIFEQTRATKARIERLPGLLEKLKRSILAAAFRGDLTKDWRAAHPNVEPASVLRERMRTERRRCWEEGLRAKGKDPAKASYEVARTELTGDPLTLPATWSWTRADEVVAPGTIITYGIVLPGKHVEGGVPYVRQQDIRDGRIDVEALLRTTPEIASKHDRSTLQAGDVLLSIIRHRRVAIVPTGLDGANITQGTVRFRPCDEIEGAYLAAWLESPVAQQWMEARVFGLDMPRINVSDTREIPIPLPPREEQLRIVQLLAAAMARLAAIGDVLANAVGRTVALEQTTLAKAFRGELVPQDPADEPAAALLERIRAARAAEPTASRRSQSAGAKERAPTTEVPTNGHDNGRRDEPLDLVIAAFQQGESRLGAMQIADSTGLDAAAVKRALATLVDSGQVRVHGRARATTYEWSP